MLDESKVLQIIDAAPGEKITDLKKAVLDAVRNPVGSAPLREVVQKGDKVVILVSDITRAWTRTSEYLPIVVEELNNSGIPDADISVIVAAGTHRANTDEEKKIIVGEDYCCGRNAQGQYRRRKENYCWRRFVQPLENL